MKTFGLTLSGGGVRALAHAGMLKALEEHNLRPVVISGTSGGALVGAPSQEWDLSIATNPLLYSKNTFLAIPLRNSPSHYT